MKKKETENKEEKKEIKTRNIERHHRSGKHEMK